MSSKKSKAPARIAASAKSADPASSAKAAAAAKQRAEFARNEKLQAAEIAMHAAIAAAPAHVIGTLGIVSGVTTNEEIFARLKAAGHC